MFLTARNIKVDIKRPKVHLSRNVLGSLKSKYYKRPLIQYFKDKAIHVLLLVLILVTSHLFLLTIISHLISYSFYNYLVLHECA